ncbi:MAG: invasion associated locus B family protein [Alphaproteobacteria bacterium]|nr:invasion associated locus B family protein [Alphaproteobacteria bacterium]
MMNTNTERLVIGGGALVLGLLLGWMGRGIASYNTGQETSTPYDDWRVACPAATAKDVSCEMVANVTDPKTKQPAARISISRDPKQGQVVVFLLPPNVNLEQGLALKLGNTDPKLYKYRTCTQQGCIALGQIDDKTADAIGSTDKATLMFISALPGATRQDIEVSRKGFAAARSAYISGNRKRSSAFWRLF